MLKALPNQAGTQSGLKVPENWIGVWSLSQRKIGRDRADDLQQDLQVPAAGLEQQRLHVREVLPHGAQRHPGAGCHPRGGGPQVTLGVQGAHRVHDGPPGLVRPGHPAVGRAGVVQERGDISPQDLRILVAEHGQEGIEPFP